MNEIRQNRTHYIRPSRTIEYLEISSGKIRHSYFVYNYEGVHFRFFENETALNSFLKHGVEPCQSFGDESELDDFLQNFCFT